MFALPNRSETPRGSDARRSYRSRGRGEYAGFAIAALLFFLFIGPPNAGVADTTGPTISGAPGTERFEQRQPRVVETFITDTSMFDTNPPYGISHVKPPNHGTPTMNNMYLLCFKIENPSDLPQTITFGWKDDRYNLVRRPQASGWNNYWDEKMSAPESWGPTNIPMNPKETIWVNIAWKKWWDWIPEQDFGDFLWDLVTSYIPVLNEYFDFVQFSQWGDAMYYFIPRVSWQTIPNGISANLSDVPPQVQVDIKVSVPKQIALYSSISAGVAAWLSTTAGMLLIEFPPAAATLLIAEAAFIVTSHSLYAAAYDPDPDFQRPVTLQRIQTRALDQVKDPQLHRQAQAALDMAANARALSEAYIKFLGAAAKNNPTWVRTHALESAKFARAMTTLAKSLQPLLTKIPETIKKAKSSDIEAVKRSLIDGRLPELEIEVLRAAGLSDKEIRNMSKVNPKGLDALIKRPELAGLMFGRMVSSLNRLATEMDKVAKGPAAKPKLKDDPSDRP